MAIDDLQWVLSSPVGSSSEVNPYHHLFPQENEYTTMGDSPDSTVRMWLVERTYSDDEQNLIILTYATTDGQQYFRKERALTSFTETRGTTAAVDATPSNIGPVDDPDLQEQYAAEAQRMADNHEPDDSI